MRKSETGTKVVKGVKAGPQRDKKRRQGNFPRREGLVRKGGSPLSIQIIIKGRRDSWFFMKKKKGEDRHKR